MKSLIVKFAPALLTICLLGHASRGFAHEGHGDPNHADGLMHYLVNPSHAVTIIVAVVGVAFGLRMALRMLRRRAEAVVADRRTEKL